MGGSPWFEEELSVLGANVENAIQGWQQDFEQRRSGEGVPPRPREDIFVLSAKDDPDLASSAASHGPEEARVVVAVEIHGIGSESEELLAQPEIHEFGGPSPPGCLFPGREEHVVVPLKDRIVVFHDRLGEGLVVRSCPAVGHIENLEAEPAVLCEISIKRRMIFDWMQEIGEKVRKWTQ